MDMLAGETEVRDYPLERLMMLSDGVFAIAMTLLALELRPPAHWDGSFGVLWAALGTDLQAFFWSFFSASMFWTVHRRLFGLYRRADGVLSALTLVLLGEITLLPVVTRIYVAGYGTTGALGIYLGEFALIGLTNTVAWTYAALAGGLVRASVGPRTRVVIALMNATLPLSMTSLGVLSTRPGMAWTLLAIPPVAWSAGALRRLAARHDAVATAA